MTADPLLAYSAPGDTRTVPCSCGADRYETGLYLLATDGPWLVGTFRWCENCGDSWACSLCPVHIPHDGGLVFDHVYAKHRWAIVREAA